MFLDVDRPLGATEFPQGGVFPLVRQRQFAAGIDQPADDHGQAILDPSLLAGVEGPVQAQLLGQFQQRVAGPVFLGGAQLHRFGRALRDHLAAEGGLQQLELREAQAGEAAVGGMFDFAVLAIRGADEADGVASVVLNFEVEARRGTFDGYYLPYIPG
jgi:hypothetical protein